MTQVLALQNLAPRIQEALLAADLRLSERQLRRVSGEASWERQVALVS